PRADRPAARRLMQSIAQVTFETGGPDPIGALFDRDRARSGSGVPAAGLLVGGGVAAGFSPVSGLFSAGGRGGATQGRPRIWLGMAAVPSALIIAGSGVLLIAGAMKMLRLHGYPLAATAAIVAMIPWSPAWLVSLPFGIWACIVLGRPAVAEAFF